MPARPASPAAAAAPAASEPAAPAASARSAPTAPANGHAAAHPAAATPATAPAAPAGDAGRRAGDRSGCEPAAATPGVGLDHAVETVRLALRAAAERGVAHARISLTPRELGTIEVHLRQTADGLVARVVAQHAAAAQLLQHGRRRPAPPARAERRHAAAARHRRVDDRTPRRPGERAFASPATRQSAPDADDPLAPLDGATETTATATLALPNGALVDVLA